MSVYVLDRAYRVDQTNGLERHRVVVHGEELETCAYPAGANVGKILGVTMHHQARDGRAVAVRMIGIAPIEAAGPIAVGDHVTIADNIGRISAATPPSALIGVQDANDAIRYRAVQPAHRNPILSVEHEQSGNNTPLSATIAGGRIVIKLATNSGGNVTSTATAVLQFVNAHAELSKLVRADLAGGTGADPAAVGEAEMTGYAASINTVGIAQESSTNPGDVIDVLLT